jgi:hypothetical protein
MKTTICTSGRIVLLVALCCAFSAPVAAQCEAWLGIRMDLHNLPYPVPRAGGQYEAFDHNGILRIFYTTDHVACCSGYYEFTAIREDYYGGPGPWQPLNNVPVYWGPSESLSNDGTGCFCAWNLVDMGVACSDKTFGMREQRRSLWPERRSPRCVASYRC